MTSRPDFEASCSLMRELSITLDETRSPPQSFGSWVIRGTANGKSLRVIWDGRDGCLIVQEPYLSGTTDEWGDRWAAGEGLKHEPSELRNGLLEVLTW